jgi:hypothetical protein
MDFMDFPMDLFPWIFQHPNVDGFHTTPLGGRDRRGLGAAGSRGTHLGGDAARALVPEAATSTSKPFFHMQNGTSTFPQYATLFCCYRLLKTKKIRHFHSKIPLSKKNFLAPFERGVSEGLRNWMKLDAHSGMNLLATHFIAEPVFIVLCFLKPEALCTKVRPL